MTSFQGREFPKTLILFDADNCLTLPEKPVCEELKTLLCQLRIKVAIGFVSGSDLSVQVERLGPTILKDFDFCFSENGLVAYKLGQLISSQSFISWIGDETYNELVSFILSYLAHLDLPKRRGTFIEFSNGMIKVSPIGKNSTVEERIEFERHDKEFLIRESFIKALQAKFQSLGLSYSISGSISFDIFPTGWDKSYALRHLENEGFDEIYFFGDKSIECGNSLTFGDSRIVECSVQGPEDTIIKLQNIFQSL